MDGLMPQAVSNMPNQSSDYQEGPELNYITSLIEDDDDYGSAPDHDQLHNMAYR